MIYCAKIVTYYSDLVERSIDVKLRKLLLCLFLSVALTVTFIPNMTYAEGGAVTVEGDGWYITINADENGCVYQVYDVGNEVNPYQGAQLNVKIFNSNHEDITADVTAFKEATFTWYKSSRTNPHEQVLDITDDVCDYTVGNGMYCCAVEYQDETQEVSCKVPEWPKDGNWKINSDADDNSGEVDLNEEQEAVLEVQVLDNYDNDVTQRNELVLYQWGKCVDYDEEDKPIFGVLPVSEDVPANTYTATAAGLYRCTVTYYDGYTDTKDFNVMEEEDIVDVVAALIVDLRDIDKLSLSDTEDVLNAQKRFDALTDYQKALISDELKTKLTNAVARINKLQSDYKVAHQVEGMIHGLGNLDDMTLAYKDQVEAAKAAYDALTDDQKAMVEEDLKTRLDDAIAIINKLQGDKDAADSFAILISALPLAGDLTLEDKTAVESVLEQYEALTPDQKAFLSDSYKTLINDIAAKMASLVYDANVEKASNLTVSGLKVTSKKKKTAVVKWKANTEASGYVIQYSMKKNFKKAKVKTIKKADAKKVKIKKLKSKKYFFRIATYTNVTDPVSGNDVVVMGKWSKPKKIKIK